MASWVDVCMYKDRWTTSQQLLISTYRCLFWICMLPVVGSVLDLLPKAHTHLQLWSSSLCSGKGFKP